MSKLPLNSPESSSLVVLKHTDGRVAGAAPHPSNAIFENEFENDFGLGCDVSLAVVHKLQFPIVGA